MTEIAVVPELLNVETGEVLPATAENAAVVLLAARSMKQRLNDVVAQTTAWLVDEARQRGTKTLASVTLSGGPTIEYDAADLMEALRVAGCPEDRIGEAVTAEITYKVNRSVLRQLAAANPDYRAAIELAERTLEKPYRASVR